MYYRTSNLSFICYDDRRKEGVFMTLTNFMDVFINRYACKQFDATKKINSEDFMTIMEAARLSPSSFGFEPWKFLLIENEQIKKNLRPFAWGALNSLDGASHFVIALSRKALTAESDYAKHIIEDVKGIPLEQAQKQLAFFQQFQANDFKLLDNQRTLFDWSSKQSYIPLANMMTAAQFLGIDSCPIEGFNQQQVENYLTSQSLMDDKQFGVSYMVSFGYGAAEQPQKKRQKMSEILQVIP